MKATGMKKTILSFMLVMALLIASVPAVAAEPAAPSFKQASKACSILTEADAKAAIAQNLKKNEVVLTLEEENGFLKVQTGKITGYVQKKQLRSVNSSALITGVAALGANASLLGDANARGAVIASVTKGAILPTLFTVGDFTAVRSGGKIGFIPTRSATFFDAKTKSVGSLLLAKNTDVKTGLEKADKRVTKAKKGALMEVLYMGTTGAVVRSGNYIGAVPLSGNKYYDSKTKATETAVVDADINLLNGAGSSFGVQTTLKKNTKLDILETSGDYYVIRSGNNIGLIRKKDVTTSKPASSASGNTPSGSSSKSYPEIKGTTVLINQDAAIYKDIKNTKSFSTVQEGVIASYIETTEDGAYVKIKLPNGSTWFIGRGDVTDIPPKKADEKATEDSKNTDTTQKTQQTEKSDNQASGLPPASGPYDTLTLDFINIMNANRTSAGQSALTIDSELMRAAAVRAQEITVVFSHTRPDGRSCFTESSKMRGENIAAGSKMGDPAYVANAFMNSPDHKANALSGNYKTTGAAYVQTSKGYYWVHLFG